MKCIYPVIYLNTSSFSGIQVYCTFSFFSVDLCQSETAVATAMNIAHGIVKL